MRRKIFFFGLQPLAHAMLSGLPSKHRERVPQRSLCFMRGNLGPWTFFLSFFALGAQSRGN